jgi:hypothetical protein
MDYFDMFLVNLTAYTYVIYLYVVIYWAILLLTTFFFSNSGPSLALVLLRENGLKYWKELLGPKTIEESIEHFPDR